MVKTLTVHGNSSALIIDKPILELLQITPKTPLKISTDGRNLIVSPLKKRSDDEKFHQALENVNRKHGKTLKKLAR